MEITINTPTWQGTKSTFCKFGSSIKGCFKRSAKPKKEEDSVRSPSTTLSTLKIYTEKDFGDWRKTIEKAHKVKFVYDKSLDRVHFWNVYTNDTPAEHIANIVVIDVKDQNQEYDLEVFISDPREKKYPWAK